MSTNFQGKVIAITGGASGIGLATAKLLAERGAIVSVADSNAEALHAAVEEIKTSTGATITGKVVDVRRRDQVDAWISSIVETHGTLHGGANIAGVMGRQVGVANVEDIEDVDWNFVLDVNMGGVRNCMSAQIKAMKGKKAGSIVDASSVNGIIGIPKNGAYCASKHAVVGLTKTAALEQAENNIRVNCIAPGPVMTPMTAPLWDGIANAALEQVPLRRWAMPSEVGELICWLLCDASSYITGTVQRIDGGWATH